MSSQEIKEILAILEESGWDEARLTIDDVVLAVSRNGGLGLEPSASPPAPPAPLSQAPSPVTAGPPPPAAPTDAAGHQVSAPSVGVFWRAPEPGAAPFVDVGDTVEAGQTLCIVEVMKLMQHVAADVAGRITAIHVQNAEHVEFGTPLFSIEPV
ncbi:MAG: acetyl-CoA carboxylase biotin carboxyl carrier protein [Actinobacteria bacterium]|nr:acetyl-CoA carboxylase biotin carboxyl carrier protein [Actinomycetota bacterium]